MTGRSIDSVAAITSPKPLSLYKLQFSEVNVKSTFFPSVISLIDSSIQIIAGPVLLTMQA